MSNRQPVMGDLQGNQYCQTPTGAWVPSPLLVIKDVLLTNNEILNLAASPKELVEAPAANEWIEVLEMWLMFDWTAAYTDPDPGATRLRNRYIDSGVIVAGTVAQDFVQATEDAMVLIGGTADSGDMDSPQTTADLTGQGIELAFITGAGELTDGDPDNLWYARLFYRIHTLPF
jgi:hypothetical protein